MTQTEKIKLIRSVITVTGLFCAVVALLLLLNYWQYSKVDPIESSALEVLVQRLREDPNNDGLKNEIRNYDLLARKAYFNSRWQVRTGAFLLLFGAVVLAFALRAQDALRAKIDPPLAEEDDFTARLLARRGVLVVGAVLFGLAIAASFATDDYLKRYAWEASGAGAETNDPGEAIEVIDVGSVPAADGPAPGNSSSASLEGGDTTGAGEGGDAPSASSVPPLSTPESAGASGTAAGTAAGSGSVSMGGGEGSTAAPSSSTPPATAGGSSAAKPGESSAMPGEASAALTADRVRQNHNSFRGPFGLGVSGHKQIPVKWNGSSGDGVLWKVPVPKHGYNSPVVWGDRIFLSGADKQSREVYCFRASDGKLLWSGKADGIPGSPSVPPKVTEDTGLAAPTVTTDGVRVYALFATGDAVAFDMEGRRVWARNLGVPDNHYGHASSLLTWNDKLFVQYDTNDGGKLLALNTATGATVWETVRKSKISWSSPILVPVNGKYQVVLTSDPLVAGYDAATGAELWSVACLTGEVGPSAGYSDGIVYAANEYATLAAIDINTRKILWEENTYLPEAASPLAHQGLLFIATSYGVLACYDGKSGEQYWEHDIGKTLYSSPVYADGKLFMMDNEGVMRIYDYGREMNLIAENPLGEITGTTPAFSNGRIYIRGENHLYCIGK